MSDVRPPEAPELAFTMLGSPDAVACEGDSCLVVPGGGLAASPGDDPGRRGVSR